VELSGVDDYYKKIKYRVVIAGEIKSGGRRPAKRM